MNDTHHHPTTADAPTHGLPAAVAVEYLSHPPAHHDDEPYSAHHLPPEKAPALMLSGLAIAAAVVVALVVGATLVAPYKTSGPQFEPNRGRAAFIP